MAVVENRSTEIGDVLYFETSIPLIGILALATFTDSTTGTTASRFFTKEFRYSTNGGITFYDWQTLNTTNISAISLNVEDIFVAEFRYTRSGTDTSGELEFNNVELDGTFEEAECGDAYNNSVFAQYFGCLDANVLNWALNVLEKLYADGIIPKHIERGVNQIEDVDYIEFWKPITIFFAYFVYLSEVFQNFSSDEDLLRSFLEERGLYFCGEEDLVELREIALNYYREIAKRGTLGIIDESGSIKGELLRLICKGDSDFFCLVYNQPKHASFNVNNSSPLSKSVSGIVGFDKSYEAGADEVTDLGVYPTIGSPSIISGRMSGSATFGIGANEADKRIVVDPSQNFEISFSVIGASTDIDLTFGVLAFNSAGIAQNMQSVIDGSITSSFFTNIDLNQDSLEYYVKGVIFNSDQANITGSTTNLGLGNNLRFTANVASIIPVITINNNSGSIAKLRVQISSLPYSKCYINSRHFTDIVLKNNNKRYSEDEIRMIMRNELVPANSAFQNTYL